jgi:hypothetical protein
MPRKRRGGRIPQRKAPKRETYSKVLIACEGSKTEPFYFQDLVHSRCINPANIHIDGSGGSSPISVVEKGINEYKKSKSDGDPYDKVFLVFDKDEHSQYQGALDKVCRQKPKGIFRAITSVPCFEYWLLLHFKDSTQPYHASGSRSAASKVAQELNHLFPNYTKNQKTLYSQLESTIDTAIANAKRSLKQAQATDTDNPTTNVHILVQYLHILTR